MGIRRRTYYSVECNHCGEDLEDFLDKFFKDDNVNLPKMADTKEKAAEIAEMNLHLLEKFMNSVKGKSKFGKLTNKRRNCLCTTATK